MVTVPDITGSVTEYMIISFQRIPFGNEKDTAWEAKSPKRRQRTDRFVLWADISAVSGNGTGHEEGEKSDNKGAAHSQKSI